MLKEPCALQSPCPTAASTALVLLTQHMAPGPRPHLQTNPPGAQDPQARPHPAHGARAVLLSAGSHQHKVMPR